MANYLKFDVYDLDLSSGRDIQSIPVTTKNRSILVIEDIDCGMELQNRDDDDNDKYPHHNRCDKSMVPLYGFLNFNQSDNSKVPLSSFLNSIDGLWSCCGDERIIVFTTNYKERLDPALLRPGRMDMHIHMSYCTPDGFRVLASNYHGLKDHFMFGEIDKLLEEVDVTPAEIAEEFMKSDQADVAFEGLIKFMQKKKVANDDLYFYSLEIEQFLVVVELVESARSRLREPEIWNLSLIKMTKMLSSLINMPSTSAVLSAYTSFTASAVVIRAVLTELKTIANQLLPGQIRHKIFSKFGVLYANFNAQMVLVIDERNGFLINNEIFEACEVYLRTKLSPSLTDRLNVFKGPQEKSFSFIITRGEKIIDEFEGVEFVWELKASESDNDGNRPPGNEERRSFELTFKKKCREMVFTSYLPFVLQRSKAIQEEIKIIKIRALGNWYGEVKLEHPSTFDTLAMDPEMKKELIEDLDRFVRRKDYYRRVGKAWKRGYLLYGPPGTGKSSLIAAMANYLKFDVYDLDLSTVRDIQSQIVSTKNRSIIVIEDIDCNMELQNRDDDDDSDSDDDDDYEKHPQKKYLHHNPSDKSKVPLSNLLNFIDGLWSCCGDERIIIFTTNYKDRLDPALLRPGRMDMHIHMSYCTPGGFRVLASNYHGLKDHIKFGEIDELIEEVKVTPAEIAEELMKSDKADVALEGLIKFMEKKKVANDELKEGSDVSKKSKKRRKGKEV